MGFKGPTENGDEDYFFVDSIPLSRKGRMPEKFRDFIKTEYKNKLFSANSDGWEALFGKYEKSVG